MIYVLVYARHKVKYLCTLVYCVGFYILYNLCSIFKRRFLEFKDHGLSESQREFGGMRTVWLCPGLSPSESTSDLLLGVSECYEAMDLHKWISI